MGSFQFFSRKKTVPAVSRGSYFFTAISDNDLDHLIRNAIDVFENNVNADAAPLILSIYQLCGEKQLAIALYRFIPIAYCRLFLSEAVYSDRYFIQDATTEREYSFINDEIFTRVAMISKERILHSANPEATFAVLYHSADFNALHLAIQKGERLETLSCSPAYFRGTE